MPKPKQDYVVRLRRSGGSESIVLPKPLRDRYGISGSVTLRASRSGILVEPTPPETASIEDEPEFARFLEFLLKDALAHPEHLVDAEQFRDKGRALVDAALT